MDRVGPKARLIPEEDLGAFLARPLRNGRIGLALPEFDGLRIALVRAVSDRRNPATSESA
jgi:hypothetical protein